MANDEQSTWIADPLEGVCTATFDSSSVTHTNPTPGARVCRESNALCDMAEMRPTRERARVACMSMCVDFCHLTLEPL